MAISTTIKNISIITNSYKPIRWLERHILRPKQLRLFKEHVHFYRSLIPDNTLCFDVGANIGEKSEVLSTLGAQVVAFEPNPLVIPELKARCGKSRNWEFLAVGLGSKTAVLNFYARKAHGSSGFIKDWQVGIIDSFHVPVITLDDAIKFFGVPYYCKIDVEGWELEVFKGLTYSIPLISFEFHLNDQNIQNTISCLERLGHFGSSSVNITPSETFSFYYKEWVPLNQFLEWFPGDLKKVLPGDPYGDIFIRSDAT